MSKHIDISELVADALVDTIRDHPAFKEELTAHIGDRCSFSLWNGGLQVSIDDTFHSVPYADLLDEDVPDCDCEAKILDETIKDLQNEAARLTAIRSGYKTGTKRCGCCGENDE